MTVLFGLILAYGRERAVVILKQNRNTPAEPCKENSITLKCERNFIYGILAMHLLDKTMETNNEQWLKKQHYSKIVPQKLRRTS